MARGLLLPQRRADKPADLEEEEEGLHCVQWRGDMPVEGQEAGKLGHGPCCHHAGSRAHMQFADVSGVPLGSRSRCCQQDLECRGGDQDQLVCDALAQVAALPVHPVEDRRWLQPVLWVFRGGRQAMRAGVLPGVREQRRPQDRPPSLREVVVEADHRIHAVGVLRFAARCRPPSLPRGLRRVAGVRFCICD